MRLLLGSAATFAVGLGFLAGCVLPRPALAPIQSAPILGLYPHGRMLWNEQIVSAALANNLIGDSPVRTFSVYLPPGYDRVQKRYPVVFLLQGFGGGGVDHTAVQATLDRLVARGEAREAILVYFDGFNKFGGSFFLTSPTIGDYESFITNELVPHIDSTYRTLSGSGTRAISGCSMGAYGALHLAFNYPDVFSIAVGNSLPGAMWSPEGWDITRGQFTRQPVDFASLASLPTGVRAHIALAAAAASNPEKPPFYLDMPFTIVDGQPEIVREVQDKVNALSLAVDARRYVAQPIRLRGLMVYQGSYDWVEYARDFDGLLTELGVDHEYLEVSAFHCALDWDPVLKFISDHYAD